MADYLAWNDNILIKDAWSLQVTILINSLPLIIIIVLYCIVLLFQLLFFRYVNSVEFHPSGTCIAAGGTDSTVKVCVCVSSILEN